MATLTKKDEKGKGKEQSATARGETESESAAEALQQPQPQPSAPTSPPTALPFTAADLHNIQHLLEVVSHKLADRPQQRKWIGAIADVFRAGSVDMVSQLAVTALLSFPEMFLRNFLRDLRVVGDASDAFLEGLKAANIKPGVSFGNQIELDYVCP